MKYSETLGVSEAETTETTPPSRNMRHGIETEYNIVDENGAILNIAPELLETGLPGLSGEPTKNVIEVNTNPYERLDHLARDYYQKILSLAKEANKRGAYLMPAAVMSPGEKWEYVENQPRYGALRKAHGEKNSGINYALIGAHFHSEQLETEEGIVDQFNLLTAMYPAFAGMSTSPILYGRNHLSNRRIPARVEYSKKFPILNEIHPYVTTYNELEKRRDIHHELHSEFLAPYLNEELDKTRAGGIVRLREHTIEMRAPDSNLPENVVSYMAAQKGILAHVETASISIGTYEPGRIMEGNTIHLPSFEEIKLLEGRGITRGLRDPLVKQYMEDLLLLAEMGLDEREKSYLSPLVIAAREGSGFSEQISDYMHGEDIDTHQILTQEQGRKGNRYATARMNDSLDTISLYSAA